MRLRLIFCLITLAMSLLLPGTQAQPPKMIDTSSQDSGSEITLGGLLNGEPRVLVVNGYSTSFMWPGILQQKIDRLLGPNVVEIRSAIKGGTPIAGWIDIETGQRLKPWNQILKPMLHDNERRRPVIVLAQQSLQGVFGSRFAGIRGVNDKRIELGAKALKQYAKALQEDGADKVFIATHIYKHPMEPEIGNESLALNALMEQKPTGIYRGPDVWTPTKQKYPHAFARDGVHPNYLGAETMAQRWFEVLLQHKPEHLEQTSIVGQ